MRASWFTILMSLSCVGFAESDIEKVNGSIEIAAEQRAGDVETVNGSIRIKAGAIVEEAETVNGSIALGERSSAESLETVNGTIHMDAEAHVGEEVQTVNGSVTLGRKANVQGGIRTVNGDIHLDAAHVGGGIHTQEGDIEVGADSRVEGGIRVEKRSGGFTLSFWKSTPRIVIGPGAVVEGALEFEREVKLYVSDTAKVGEIKGATPVRFSGEKPED